MERRDFIRFCAASALAAPAVAADAQPRFYSRAKLVDPKGEPLRAKAIPPNTNLIFHYPFAATPCFLLNLGRPAKSSALLKTAANERYEWHGGVGPARAVVAYSAVASFQALDRPLAGRAILTRPLDELAPAIRAPVLIHHGEADRVVPASQGILLHRALVAAGGSSTLHLYPGSGHLFNFALGAEAVSDYRPEADRLSWERTLAFLARHLGPRAP